MMISVGALCYKLLNYTTSGPNIRLNWLLLERLMLQNKLLNHDIFDIFLDYTLVCR